MLAAAAAADALVVQIPATQFLALEEKALLVRWP
jgi:hypothetical protein